MRPKKGGNIKRDKGDRHTIDAIAPKTDPIV